MTAKEVATCGFRGWLREVKCICEDGDEVVSITIVDDIDRAREDVKKSVKLWSEASRAQPRTPVLWRLIK